MMMSTYLTRGLTTIYIFQGFFYIFYISSPFDFLFLHFKDFMLYNLFVWLFV